MIKWLLVLPVALFLGLAAMFWVGMGRNDPNTLPSAFLGKQAPVMTDATLPGIPGITLSLIHI